MTLFDPPETRTERLVISPIVRTDAAAARQLLVDDPLVTRYVGWRALTDDERSRRFVEIEAQAWEEKQDCRGWLARRHDTGDVVGFVIARRHDTSAEFSYVVNRACWNQGFGTEMAGALRDRARSDPRIGEIWAVCDIENEASHRVLEKAGLTLDCTLPRHQVHNVSPEPRDCLRFSLRFR